MTVNLCLFVYIRTSISNMYLGLCHNETPETTLAANYIYLLKLPTQTAISILPLDTLSNIHRPHLL